MNFPSYFFSMPSNSINSLLTHPLLDNTHGIVFRNADGTYYSKLCLMGDVNNDGLVNDADIVALADYILNPVDDSFPVNQADMNGDKVIDVYDIVALRNYIDKQPLHEGDFTARLYAANTTIKAAGTRKVNVTLSTALTATAMQTDIKFGSLLSAKSESVLPGTILSASHIIKARPTKDGIRILVYSLNQESLSKEVNRALEQLSPRERDILKMFFGIGCQEMTLEEIGAKFDLTRERVRQIKEKAIRRLKGQKSKLLKSYLG